MDAIDPERLVLGSNVSVEVALLGKAEFANGTKEFRLHAALVISMSPERREHGVHAVAIGTTVSLLPSPPLHWRLLDVPRGSERLLAAFEHSVAGERCHQGKSSVAIGADVFPRSPSVHLGVFVP